MAVAIEDIAPDGDVVLLVGPGKHRLRVSSHILSQASRVFKALFGPHFREGQQKRSTVNPVEISLPEDDAKALISLCKWLHAVEVTTAWTSLDLLRVANTIDKYDCGSALVYHTQAIIWDWLHSCSEKGSEDSSNLGHIATAAYRLNHSRIFKEATNRLFTKTSKFEDQLESMPSKLRYMIQHRQLHIQNYVRDMIPKMMVADCCSPDGCACVFLNKAQKAQQEQGGVQEAMAKVCDAFRVSFWPSYRLFTPHEVEQYAPKLVNEDRAWCTCGDNDEKLTDVDWNLNQLRGMCVGLCLLCVREQEMVDPVKTCDKAEHRV